MIQGQRVRRVIRQVDTWSVLRVSVLFHLSLMLVFVLAGVMLWLVGSLFGAIDSVESFMDSIGFDGFTFVGGQVLRGVIAAGLVLVVLGSGAAVLSAVLYNLIADVVGGIELSVLEEVAVLEPDLLQIVDPEPVDPESEVPESEVPESEVPESEVPEPADRELSGDSASSNGASTTERPPPQPVPNGWGTTAWQPEPASALPPAADPAHGS
ncbi:MAG: DUF3566 domain-containing protein [Acidimicrobiales bacterium]